MPSPTDRLVDAALKIIRGIDAFERKPGSALYHFTDAAGLTGLLQRKVLWATRASCMNDASELHYGKELARNILRRRLEAQPKSVIAPIWTYALAYLDGAPDVPSILRLRFDAFVVSFCAKADKSVHWLHYGRGGFGYAVGLDAAQLQSDGWSLVPVVYSESEQLKICTNVIEELEELAAETIAEYGAEMDRLPKIHSMVGHLISDSLAMIAPGFKHPAFASEEEWRLFRNTLERDGEPVEGSPTILLRARGHLVVPYLEAPLVEGAIKEVVMGYQVSDHPSRESIRMLLRAGGTNPASVAITNSTVPARGAA